MATKTKKKVGFEPKGKKFYEFDMTELKGVGSTLKEMRLEEGLSRYEFDRQTDYSYHELQRVEESIFPAFTMWLEKIDRLANLFGYELRLRLVKKG